MARRLFSSAAGSTLLGIMIALVGLVFWYVTTNHVQAQFDTASDTSLPMQQQLQLQQQLQQQQLQQQQGQQSYLLSQGQMVVSNISGQGANEPPFFKKSGGSCLLGSNFSCAYPAGSNVSDGKFWGIGAIESDSNSVYVTDEGNHRVQKFDANLNFLTEWGSHCEIVSLEGQVIEIGPDCVDPEGPAGFGAGQFNRPAGVAVYNGTRVLVTDLNNRTQLFDTNGKYLGQIGSTGSGPGEFRNPHGIAVDSRGQVFIADTENSRIQKFDNNGTFLIEWGSTCKINNKYENQSYGEGCLDPDGLGPEETGDGQFNTPMDVAIDYKDNALVSDTGNHRIQKFDNNGRFIGKLGSECEDGKQRCVRIWDDEGILTSPGEFYYPVGLETQEELVYVTDLGNHQIQVFDENFTFITKWGSHCFHMDARSPSIDCIDKDGFSGELGIGDGQFNSPTAISQSQNYIYVGDSNNLIQIFSAPSIITKAPIANAGSDYAVPSGSFVFLDGSQSRDPDGRITIYRWEQIASPSSPFVYLIGNNQPVSGFIAPQITGTSILAFRLNVIDNENATSQDISYVTVSGMPTNNSTPASTTTGTATSSSSSANGNGAIDEGSDDEDNDAPEAPPALTSLQRFCSIDRIYLRPDFSGEEDDSIDWSRTKWKVMGGDDSWVNLVPYNKDTGTWIADPILPDYIHDGPGGPVTFEMTVTDEKNSESSDMVTAERVLAEPRSVQGLLQNPDDPSNWWCPDL